MNHKFYLFVLFLICTMPYKGQGQNFKFNQTSQTPKFIKPGTVSDTLLNPFAGGLNAPQFSNIDWNGDGKPDLFIFDKEARKVLSFVYSNNTFVHTPKYEAGFPSYMHGWALLRDHNFDNKPDLFTSSFTFNQKTADPYIDDNKMQLYVNKTSSSGNSYFDQYNNVLFDTGFHYKPWDVDYPPKKIPAENKAIPAIDDIDGDGDMDLLTNEGFFGSIILTENFKRNKYNIPYSNDTTVYVFRDKCWGFIQYNQGNYFTISNPRIDDGVCFQENWGKKARHADQSMTLIDLNGDGIKDLIFSDYEYNNLIALYNGRLQNTIKADSIVAQDTLFLSKTNTRRNFIQYPASYYVDINGDNKKELVISTNQATVPESVNNIWIFNADRVNSNLVFDEMPGNDFLYKDMIDMGSRSAPAFVDMDKDGDMDLVVAASGVFSQTGNNHDKLYLFLNIGNAQNPVFKLADENLADISGTSQLFGAHPSFGDLNGDGKPDLVVGENQGNVAYYENTSTSNTSFSFNLINRNFSNITVNGYSTPQLIDLDKDGLLDLVVGSQRGTIPYYRNTGTATAPVFASTPTVDSIGNINTCEAFPIIGFDPFIIPNTGFSAPHIVDLNGDGKYELVTGSMNGRIYLYTNIYPSQDSTAKLIDNSVVDFGKDNNAGYNKRFGANCKIASANLDNDTLPDLILGNVSGGLNFLANKFTKEIVHPGLTSNYINDESAISLYPNPANTSVHVKLNRNTNNNIGYFVYDVTGRKIQDGMIEKHQSANLINVSGIKPGLYFIKFEEGSWYSVQRLVIE